MGFNERGTVVFTGKPYWGSSRYLYWSLHPSSVPLLLFLLFVLSIWIKKPKCYLTQRLGKPAQHPDKRSERREKGVGDKSCMGLCESLDWGPNIAATFCIKATSFKVEAKRWGQATLQSPCNGIALRWDSRERNNLTLAPCLV